MLSPPLKYRLCVAGFCLAVVFKFWLIWESEIADALDDPHEYVLQILYPANGGLAYPPGTGLIGQLFHAFGIPFRLGMETVLMIAAMVLIRALFAWPWKNFLSLGLLAFVIFDPAVNELFSHIYSDEGWLVTSMLGVSLFTVAWRDETKPSWSLVFWSAMLLGFSTITRSVFVPLVLAFIAFAALSAILLRAKRDHPGVGRSLFVFLCGIAALVLGIFLVYEGTCTYNSRAHRYTGLSVLDSTEFKKFYLCLESVGEPTGVPYFPIDQDRRNLIAQAGPNSKQLMDALDQDNYYKEISLKQYGRRDLACGWFHWAVFGATMNHGDYLASFTVFQSVEDEIATASRLGHLKVRAIVPLPDSRIHIVASALPDGLRNTVDEILREPAVDTFTWKDGRYENPEFTAALTRRSVAPSHLREYIWRELVVIYSWIYSPALLYLLLIVVMGFLFLLVFRWYRFPKFSQAFLAQQLFLVFFMTFIFWYALFDASGMPVVSRYMIFNHLLLVPMLAYYLRLTIRLFRNEREIGV